MVEKHMDMVAKDLAKDRITWEQDMRQGEFHFTWGFPWINITKAISKCY